MRRQTTVRLMGILLLLVLLALPTTALAQATLTISPTSGPAGTSFSITGSGFPANDRLIGVVLGPNNEVKARNEVATNAGGAISLTYDSSGDAPGQYTVGIGRADGTVLASGTFTVTAGAGAMPRSGDGGRASGSGLAPWLLAGVGALALAGLTAGRMRRRHVA